MSASDFEGHAPAHRRNFQGGNDNETGMTTDSRRPEEVYGELINGTFFIGVPFNDSSCSVCLNTSQGNFLALSLNDAVKHVGKNHGTPNFRCTNCQKEYVTKHAALCHVPKCTGPKEPGPNAVMCLICQVSFNSKRGLSQHERHVHPALRNQARAEPPRDEAARPLRVGGFTEDEVSLMLTLERRFFGDRCVAKKMEGYLNRTARQLRDKRANLNYIARRDEYLRNNPPSPEDPSIENPAMNIGDHDESTEQEEVVPPSSPPEVEGEAVQPRLEVEIPTITVTPAPDLPSPDETAWREGICSAALGHELPRRTMPSRSAEAIKLLRGALQIASELDYNFTQAQIDHIYKEATSFLVSKENEEGGERRPKRVRKKRGTKRQYIFGRTQDLFKKNPGELARHVRSEVDWLDGYSRPKASDVRELYTKLWGTQPQIELPETGQAEDPIILQDALPPFSIKEINARVARINKSTAPGPDGIKRLDVNHWDRKEVLHLLFNLLLLSGKQPTEWRMNRTTLIPKPGKDASRVENYRPITIGSLLSRIYWGCIDQKFRSKVRFTPRQKGFTSEAGCFNNIHILAELLRHSKSCSKDLVVTILDISKAFDTIPHKAVGPSLQVKGLPHAAVRMVESSYENVYTKISSADDEINIKLQRGVKQGDPLSPFIFNAVIEPLLHKLESQPGYRINDTSQIACLAFADDIVLVSEAVQQAQDQLQNVEAYLKGLGMNLSASKCATFHITHKNQSWSVADPGLTLQSGERIPHCGAGGRFTYLGVEISPWAGIDIKSVGSSLESTLLRVKRLALKPHQKVQLISTYLIPHYLYQLGMAVPSVTAIRQLDQAIRVVIKDIFHLAQSTTNSLLYCAKRDGGLGFPRLETLVVGATLRAGSKFVNSTDPAIRALAVGAGLVDRLTRLARGARLTWPVSAEQIRAFKLRAKKQELQTWASLGSQGKSVASLTDSKTANAWLYNPSLLKPSRYITALKMRTNTCQNRVALNRAAPQPDLQCRQCKSRLETLGHILGECTSTKLRRIRRHDEISELVMQKLTKQRQRVAIVDEPMIRHPQAGNLKPDLVVKSQEGVYVVDVTVRHEDGDSLALGHLDKVNKYNQLLPVLQERLRVTSGEVLPIVVGTRGAMPKETVKSLAKLGIKDKPTLVTISMIALRCSIEIFHDFMDYDRPPRGRQLQMRPGEESFRHSPGPQIPDQ